MTVEPMPNNLRLNLSSWMKARHYDDHVVKTVSEYEKVIANGVRWQPISTAPDLERVLVCGYTVTAGRRGGSYWWGVEACYEGRAVYHPKATHWCPVMMPEMPVSPLSPEAQGGS